MEPTLLHWRRGPEILKILAEHGPLSLPILMAIVNPPMTLRRLQDATKRLSDRGLVVRRFDSLPKNAGHYFQICQTLKARGVIGNLLNVDPESLIQTQFRSQELTHSESCALWTTQFRKWYPEGRVIRDYALQHNKEACRVLMLKDGQFELQPDLLLQLPSSTGSNYINVAIEVERTRKTSKRIAAKLRKFAKQSHLDGVLYICSRESLVDLIRPTYVSTIMNNAGRIKQYGSNFLMFSDGTISGDLNEMTLFNTEPKAVLLKDWIHYLVHTQLPLRRDVHLNSSAQPR